MRQGDPADRGSRPAIQAAGGATRTSVRDRNRAARKRAHGIVAKLRMRIAQGKDRAQAVVKRIPGELADLRNAPPSSSSDAERLLANARHALRRAQARAKHRPRLGGAMPPAVDDVGGCVGRLTT